MRKAARRNAIAPCSNLEEENEGGLHSAEDIEDDFVQKELMTQTNKIIESLPEKIRTPLALYYLFDLSVEQIAHTIKKPPGTVKSRLFKGRNLIKKRLEEIGYEK